MKYPSQIRASAAALCAVLLLEASAGHSTAWSQAQSAPSEPVPFSRQWTNFFASMPAQTGRLEEIYDSRRSKEAPAISGAWSDRSVLLIEDEPASPEVQKRVASLITSIVSRSGISLIAVEGAEGDASLSFLKKLSSPGRRREVGREFVEHAKLSGAEWAHLTSRAETVLWGAENSDRFSRSAELYLKAMGAREHARRHLKRMSLVLALFLHKEALLSEPLKPRVRQSVLSLSSLTRMLDSEPGALEAADLREMSVNYRAAAQNINDAVRELGLGETGVFFSDPVFDQIGGIDAEFVKSVRQRDTEAVRRMLEAMDDRRVHSAVWVVRPERMPRIVAEVRRLGVSYLRAAPGTGAASTPAASSAYRRELTLSFGAGRIGRAAGVDPQESERLFIGRPSNPLRVLPLMAQAPLDLDRGRTPRLAELARALSPEAGARVGNLMAAFGGAAQAGPGPRTPVSRGRGNSQLQLETMPIPPQAALPDLGPRDTWLGSSDEESQTRYLVFQEHLTAMNVELPGRTLREEKKPLSAEMIQAAAAEYARRLNSLVSHREEVRLSLVRSVENAVVGSGNIFASSSIGPVWSLFWGDPGRREGILAAAARYGWIRPLRARGLDLKRARTDHAPLIRFLRETRMRAGIPKSYRLPEGYWEVHRGQTDKTGEVDRIIERQIAENSLSIYDGAVWQIALALASPRETAGEVRGLTRVLTDGKLGDFETIRAYRFPYRYGDRQLPMPKSAAFFFRIIADRYTQPDPMGGATRHENFPNQAVLHHEDWKPVMGEQAWAAVLGPLHSERLLIPAGIPASSQAEELAASLLPAFETLMSPIGAVYHVPHGTHGKSGYEISTENNLSLLAAVRMLHKSLSAQGRRQAAERAAWIMNGLQSYFRGHAFDRSEGIFIQGGHYLEGRFIPASVFAADCQTWGIAALGPDWIDREFGEGAARKVWQTTRRRSGTFDAWGNLEGIGFTDQEDVISIEWTAGAILACRMLAAHYAKTRPDWAQEFESDAVRMRLALDKYRVRLDDGSEAYLYSNRRFFIPFGWWANPVPSLVSTAWIILLDRGYNPFWPEGKYPASP
jgi:hypothetical protein